jgi:hypothetical protein
LSFQSKFEKKLKLFFLYFWTSILYH